MYSRSIFHSTPHQSLSLLLFHIFISFIQFGFRPHIGFNDSDSFRECIPWFPEMFLDSLLSIRSYPLIVTNSPLSFNFPVILKIYICSVQCASGLYRCMMSVSTSISISFQTALVDRRELWSSRLNHRIARIGLIYV